MRSIARLENLRNIFPDQMDLFGEMIEANNLPYSDGDPGSGGFLRSARLGQYFQVIFPSRQVETAFPFGLPGAL